MMNMNTMMMSRIMAEDCGAPELRNPENGAMRHTGWLSRLFAKITRK